MKLVLRIITGAAEYRKEIAKPYPNQWQQSMRVLCCDTMNQLESEQYILQKGFVRVVP